MSDFIPIMELVIVMEKDQEGLLIKFAYIFLSFAAVVLVLCGVNAYIQQSVIYKNQCAVHLQDVATNLKYQAEAEGEIFAGWERYMSAHRHEVTVPDGKGGDFRSLRAGFLLHFATRYPGQVLGQTVTLEGVDEETKLIFARYLLSFWRYVFDRAAMETDVDKVSLYVPMGGDTTRLVKIIGDNQDEIFEESAERPQMWAAWNTGEIPADYDEYDSGSVYACYAPVIINGKKIGLIGTEATVAGPNKSIVRNVLKQVAGIGFILFLCLPVMLRFINKRYIAKISRLQSNVRQYASRKDPYVADAIRREAKGNDEIAALSRQIASMIWDLEEHMRNLRDAAQELYVTKKRVDDMDKLAMSDALTGLRNKAAYDHEVKRIEKSIPKGEAEFGIAMIDLNFLKRTNDTYGHDKGNISIKNLSDIVCQIFAHSPVFRIGGDEFVVVLERQDFKNRQNLVDIFNHTVERFSKDESLPPWERVSASLGYAVYDAEIDKCVEDVFKRADKEMYNRKQAMKAMRTD